MKPTTVLLADDHAIIRESLRNLLSLNPGFEVVAEASTGREAIDLTRKLKPNIVVMDIAMPVVNGFEATRQIRQIAPETKILVLSAHSDDEYVARMAAVGAAGYIVKQDSGQVLIHAIKQMIEGKAFFSASILKRMTTSMRRARENGSLYGGGQSQKLTSRETEVLQLVAEGAANKQIAAQLGISIKTVEKHRQQLMDKLDIHETAGLTRYAVANHVVDVSAAVGEV